MIISLDTTRYIWEVLENQEYSFLFKDLVVLDLGCNIGAFSLWLYPFVKRIYAVDMDSNSINLFNETIKANKLNKVETFVEKVQDGRGTTGSVGEFMLGHNIPYVDIMKIDIEGDELSVVRANDFPADKIRNIVGECHYSGVRAQEFKIRLEDLGYRYTEYPNNHFLARR